MEKTYVYNGQETNYIITSDGKVFNKKTNRELKGTYSRNEYHSVQLTINGKPKSFMVHRLVAEMFCDNPNNYEIVDHIDRDKYNNNYTNLRWVSNSANSFNKDKKKKEIIAKKVENFNLKDWRPFPQNKNYYVNKEGQIINFNTKTYLKGAKRNEYVRVYLQGKYYSLHRVVWESFNGEIPNEMIVDHIDGNRSNNNLSNLKLVFQSENILSGHIRNHSRDIIVKQYNSKGEYINTFYSMAAAAKSIGKTKDAVRAAANRHGTCGGYFWIRKDDNITIEELLKITTSNKPKKTYIGVTQYSLEGKKIAYYTSIKEAARTVNCADSTIQRAAKAKRIGKGYYWIFDNQNITIEDLIGQ